MHILDSKVISTQFEKEIYIDEQSNLNLSDFHYPGKSNPYYGCRIGLKLLRIRDNNFYGNKQSYFYVKISEDLQYFTIIEPEQQSIFAAKNEQEKEASKELIQYLLIDSPAFKGLIETMIQNLKEANVLSSGEIKEVKGKLDILNRLDKISSHDLEHVWKKRFTA